MLFEGKLLFEGKFYPIAHFRGFINKYEIL